MFKILIAFAIAGFSTAAFACDKAQVRMQTPEGYPPEAAISFSNQSPEKITVQWVDFDGELVTYTELMPGEAYEQPSYEGHMWVIADSSNNCFGPFVAGDQKDAVVIK